MSVSGEAPPSGVIGVNRLELRARREARRYLQPPPSLGSVQLAQAPRLSVPPRLPSLPARVSPPRSRQRAPWAPSRARPALHGLPAPCLPSLPPLRPRGPLSVLPSPLPGMLFLRHGRGSLLHHLHSLSRWSPFYCAFQDHPVDTLNSAWRCLLFPFPLWLLSVAPLLSALLHSLPTLLLVYSWFLPTGNSGNSDFCLFRPLLHPTCRFEAGTCRGSVSWGGGSVWRNESWSWAGRWSHAMAMFQISPSFSVLCFLLFWETES